MPPTLQTARLLLRPWRDEDLEPFAAMNADPRVMEHFPALLSYQESEAMMARLRDHFESEGFGLWAVEVPNQAPFIGFVGLAKPRFDAHFMPAVEIGYRLAVPYWRQGYAFEASLESLRFGFEEVQLSEIVAMTTHTNLPSQALMQKLGMQRDPNDDFDHPLIPAGHRLKRCVLYRLSQQAWRAAQRFESTP